MYDSISYLFPATLAPSGDFERTAAPPRAPAGTPLPVAPGPLLPDAGFLGSVFAEASLPATAADLGSCLGGACLGVPVPFGGALAGVPFVCLVGAALGGACLLVGVTFVAPVPFGAICLPSAPLGGACLVPDALGGGACLAGLPLGGACLAAGVPFSGGLPAPFNGGLVPPLAGEIGLPLGDMGLAAPRSGDLVLAALLATGSTLPGFLCTFLSTFLTSFTTYLSTRL